MSSQANTLQSPTSAKSKPSIRHVSPDTPDVLEDAQPVFLGHVEKSLEISPRYGNDTDTDVDRDDSASNGNAPDDNTSSTADSINSICLPIPGGDKFSIYYFDSQGRWAPAPEHPSHVHCLEKEGARRFEAFQAAVRHDSTMHLSNEDSSDSLSDAWSRFVECVKATRDSSLKSGSDTDTKVDKVVVPIGYTSTCWESCEDIWLPLPDGDFSVYYLDGKGGWTPAPEHPLHVARLQEEGARRYASRAARRNRKLELLNEGRSVDDRLSRVPSFCSVWLDNPDGDGVFVYYLDGRGGWIPEPAGPSHIPILEEAAAESA